MSNTLFGNLAAKTEKMEAARDSVGGFAVRDSDIYAAVLKLAYAGRSKGGANFLSLVFTMPDGTEYKEDAYFTSGDDKGNLPYYTKNDKHFPLPGYTLVSDLLLITAGTSLEEANFEEKVVNVYDAEAKKEMPKSVMVPVDALGKPVSIAIQKVLEVKQQKNEATGQYEDTAETREVNNIDKVFDTDSKFTVIEAQNNAEAPVFYDKWLEANKGKVRDNTKKKGGGNAAAGGAAGAFPKAGGASAAPKQSLFGKKS